MISRGGRAEFAPALEVPCAPPRSPDPTGTGAFRAGHARSAMGVTPPRESQRTVEVAAVRPFPTVSRVREVAVLAAVRSATLIGVDGQPVTVEVHVSSGLPAYQVVGLPDAAVRESRERVRAAVLSSGLEWPQRRITVNLAPGGVRKSGSGLELAVALGALGANEALPAGVLDGVAVLGELGLDGAVRPVPGTLALVDALGARAASSVSWCRSPTRPRPRSSAVCACAPLAPWVSCGPA